MKPTRDDVRIFADFCVYVRSIYMHHEVLFKSERRANLLSKTAPVFFGDLNKILIEYVILQVCKITDPAVDARGNTNHSIEFFAHEAETSFDAATAKRLAELTASMCQLRDKLKSARNKIISHLDRDTNISNVVLGRASENQWDQFWRDLDEFVAIVYEKYIGSPPLHIMKVGGITDAALFFNSIRRGTYFEKLAESTDEEIRRKCLEIEHADWIGGQLGSR